MSSSAEHYPVAIMAFNRPAYLQQVVESLRSQTPSIDSNDIHVFQDGFSGSDGSQLADAAAGEQNIILVRKAFPAAHIHSSDRNLGVALNFARAEKFFFETLKVEAAIFLEDDLILAPCYFKVLRTLVSLALIERRIAYVAAYGDHKATVQQQREHARELIMMRHKWGFALTKRQWLAQQPIIEPYLEIVSRKDYHLRDHQAIKQYYRTLGFGSDGTSQDAMKDVASAVLGTTKVMTYACFAKNIGERGLHSSPEFYRQEKFHETAIFPDPPPVAFDLPTAAAFDRWIQHDRDYGRHVLANAP